MDERAKLLRVAAVFKVTHVDIKICHDGLAAAQGFIDVFSHSEGLPAAGPSVYKIDHNDSLSFSERTENMLFAACYERQDIDAGRDLLYTQKKRQRSKSMVMSRHLHLQQRQSAQQMPR